MGGSMKYFVPLLLISVPLCFAQGLLTNGDFEQDLTIGWLQAQSGSYIYIDRATTYDGDPDYEAKVHKDYAGTGYATLYQAVDVPSTDLTFSCNAKIWAYDNDADTLTWAGAAVKIMYLNSSGGLLGETRICDFTAPGTWQSSSTRHLIMVSDSLWHNYVLNINDEITNNLPGVNPAQVARIQIALHDTTVHTC